MTHDPRPSLRLHFTQGLTFGRGKADLLDQIASEGSISAAGRKMGMSYRRAWSLVEEMNAAFAQPLVESVRGGPGGGGAQLTETGRAVLESYRAVVQAINADQGDHLATIRALLKSDMPERK